MILHTISQVLYVFSAWWGILMLLLILAFMLSELAVKINNFIERIAPATPSVDADLDRIQALSDKEDRNGANPSVAEYAAARNAEQLLHRRR